MSDEARRVPPHSLEAEEGLLGSCLIDPGQDILSACMEVGLRAEAFFKPAHQVVYQILNDLFEKGDPVDEVTVLNALQSRTVGNIEWLKQQQRFTDPHTPLIQMIGGAGTLVGLTDRIESIANARHWLEIVRQKWLLRRLIQTAGTIAEEAYVNQDQLDHFIDSVEQQILAINEEQVDNSAQKFEQAIDEAGHLIQHILAGNQEDGVLTGYTDVDKMTFGLHSGQMVILAARPSMGKTSLGMNIAENVGLPLKGNPKSVLVFSLEMPSEQLAMRMLCGRAKVSMRRVRDRMLGKEQQRELGKAATVLRAAPLWVDDTSGLNILQLRAKARRLRKQHSIDLVVVDYLQLISGTDARVPREQQISEISRGLKAMAKELDLPVLVLSQLNRASEKENRQPRISDLRESGSIEQDADVVFLLSARLKTEEENEIPQAARDRELIIAKQRNGPTGSVPLTFIPEFTRFENHTPQREP